MSETGDILLERIRSLRGRIERARDGGRLDVDGALAEVDRLARTVRVVAQVAVDSHSELEDRVRDVSVLRRTAALFASFFDLERLSLGVLDLVGETVPAEHGMLFLTDAQGRLFLQAVRGRRLDDECKQVAEQAAGAALERGELTVVPDTLSHDALARLPGAMRMRSVLSAPLIAFGEPIGVIQLAAVEPSGLDADAQRLLAPVADLTAAAVHQARLCEIMLERGDDLSRQVRARTFELDGTREALARSERMAGLVHVADQVAEEVRNPLTWMLSDLRRSIEYLGELEAAVPPLEVAAEAACALPGEGDAQVAGVRRAAREALGARRGRTLAAVMRDFQETLTTLREGVERLTDVAEDVTGFAGDEAAGREADLNALVETALHRVGKTAKPAIHFEKRLDPLPPIRCHRLRISQLLSNLLENAVEALGDDGSVRVTSTLHGRFVRVEVSDDGPGVHGDVERIFQPFYSTKGPGRAGLGLAIARDVAAEHGGNLSAESSPEGTTFRLTLPVAG